MKAYRIELIDGSVYTILADNVFEAEHEAQNRWRYEHCLAPSVKHSALLCPQAAKKFFEKVLDK